MRGDLARKALVVVVFAVILFSALIPIRDPDLFWHLATGRWIWEHKALPDGDPFSYTTSVMAQDNVKMVKVILTQYWLANLIEYGTFSMAGYEGIIGLRLLIVFLTLLCVFLNLRRRGIDMVLSCLLLLPLAYILCAAPGDRPNQMTFLFLALFLYLADELKRGSRAGYLLPAVAVVWANIHGGFILLGVLGPLAVAAEVLKGFLIRDYRIDRKFITVMALTVLGGFLNPNGYTALYSILKESGSDFASSEMKSPAWYLSRGKERYFLYNVFFGAAFAGAFFRAVFGRNGQTTARFQRALLRLDALFYVSFGLTIAFLQIRFIPVLAVIVTPLLGGYFPEQAGALRRRLSRSFVPELAVAGALIWLAVYFYPYTFIGKPLVDPSFPAQGASFMQSRGMKGNTFNFYDWGGYLIWRFYPEKRVFMDGRALDQWVYQQYRSVMTRSEMKIGGIPAYRAILDTYSIRHIIIPPVDRLAHMDDILSYLVEDDAWHLVFYDFNTLIFTRDPVERSFPKTIACTLVLDHAVNMIEHVPYNLLSYYASAKARLLLGQRQEAITMLRSYLGARPFLRGGPIEKALFLIEQDLPLPNSPYDLE